MIKGIKLLFVEEDETLITSVIDGLKADGYRPEYETVTSASLFEKAVINCECDIIIFDEPSDDFDIFTALAILRGCECNIPVICICGEEKEDTAIRAMSSGARDYVTRNNLNRLAPLINRELNDTQLRNDNETATERVKTENAIRESDELYRTLVENSPSAIAIHCDGKLVYVNNTCLDLMRATEEDAIGKPVIDFVHSDYRELVSERIKNVLEKGIIGEAIEEKFLRPDGTVIDVEVVSTPITYEGKPAVQTVIWDISEHIRVASLLAESEERYRTLQYNIPVGVFRSDAGPDGKIVSANPAFAEMFRYDSIDELLDVRVTNFYLNAEDREKFTKTMNAAGVVEDYEVELKREDGETFWGVINATAVKGDDGKVTYFDGVLIDITERKQAEETLKRERQAFAVIAEAAAEAADTSDLSQRILDGLVEILDFGLGSVRLFDLASGALTPVAFTGNHDKSVVDIMKPVSIGNEYCIASLVARTGESVFAPDVSKHRISKTHKKRLDELRLRSIISWPLLDIDRKLLGVIQLSSKAVKEMSGKERIFFGTIAGMLATALGKKLADDEMIELRRAKDTLTDLVVHDIKNISSTMFSWLEMMDEGILGELTKEQKEGLDRVIKRNEDLFHLSEEMLDIAKAEEGEITLDKNPYALDEQVLDVIEYYRPTADKESKVMRRRFTDGPIIINADEARIKRVVANLIQNAIQFAPANSGKVFVSARTDERKNTAVVKVTDNGPGIPEAFQTLIFEKYSQTELKMKGVKKGYGLGLTFCKMIIEAHGGSIKAESDGKNGSAFTFSIPLYQSGTKRK
ncbi:MAG: PAS domain S-box protein [bacterium]|nr:PAS domain S-box protein [bacterium]